MIFLRRMSHIKKRRAAGSSFLCTQIIAEKVLFDFDKRIICNEFAVSANATKIERSFDFCVRAAK